MTKRPREAPRVALSVRQPWAWALLFGGKNVENRTWSTRCRGRIWIHASKREIAEDIDCASGSSPTAGAATPTGHWGTTASTTTEGTEGPSSAR